MDQLQVDPATGQKADGFLWGIPRDVSTFALYLNLDLIDKAGAENPIELAKNGEWTWDKFAGGRQARSPTSGGTGVKGFGANSLVGQLGLLRELRRAARSSTTTARPATSTRPSRSPAWSSIKGLYDAGSGVKFGEDAEPPFKAGKLGMFINGRWATPGSREITDFNWDVAPLPDGRCSRQELAVLGRLRDQRQDRRPGRGL